MSDAAANRPKPRRARGLMDRRGPGLALERGLIARIAKVYETWGFEPLETPAFEYADALGKFLPDQDRPNEGVFALQDDDEQWLALRYDLTAPLARFVAENFDALPKPYRRWAAGPVWRNEKPGPGRFREFWQCDADTVGAASPAADAEMIAVACAGLEAAGVPRGGYQVKFSTRKLLDAVLENIGVASDAYATRLVVLRAIDKFDRLGRQGVELLLGDGRKDESGDFTKGAGLDAKQRGAVIDLVSAGAGSRGEVLERLAKIAGEAAIAELREIDAALSALGVDDAGAAIDPTIVRGLEYYTGAVFEAQLIGAGGASFGSVGGGGRYDDLVSRFRGERIPATGFSIGVSRLAAALQAQQAAEADGPVVVLVMDQARVADALGMAAELRAAGVRAEAYLGGGGMKAQLKYADKRAAPVAVIQGGDELAKGVVTLKDLKLGARIASELGEDREAYAKAREKVQQEAPRARLVAAVKAMLG
ncbi:MAG: histidine--tRNA ligase [Caulobacterales bacterium]|jgi:histidyl-tRNA synthetase|nr:histidine--tRNA ligase [Caulobacterales bacterium]